MLNPWEYPNEEATCPGCSEVHHVDNMRDCPTCGAWCCRWCHGDPFCAACRENNEPQIRLGDGSDEYQLYRDGREWAIWFDSGAEVEGMSVPTVKSEEALCYLLRDWNLLDGVSARLWDRWEEIVAEQYGRAVVA